MNLLICGDSFAADWSQGQNTVRGWPNLLAHRHSVVNLAQAGCSEYRIWQQIKSKNLDDYDRILISHTSPYRIYVKQHPIHQSGLHQCCDLIYSDAVEHQLQTVKDWFENYFDLDYAKDIHHLIMSEIDRATSHKHTIHIGHFDISAPQSFDFVDFSDVWKMHPGDINHYSKQGNKIIFERIEMLLK